MGNCTMAEVRRKINLGRSILAAVSHHRNIDAKLIVGRDRQRDVMQARRDVCEMAHEAGIGCVIIGRILNRDHTTILSHVSPTYRAHKNRWRYKQNARRAG